MANRGRRATLLSEVQRQIEQRTGGPVGELKSAQESLAYLNWLAWHCGRFVAVPSFLGAARSDIVAILYAGAIGMERSAYLHGRSLLENLIRHCYYDSRPALFATRHLAPEDDIQDKWNDLFKEIQRLPQFRPTWETLGSGAATQGDDKAILGGSALFAELKAAYTQASRFVHGSTARYRSAYEGIGSITIDKKQTDELGAFLQQLSEASLLLLAMAHLGPYLLISQPIRRYMLTEAMRESARRRFLRCMQRVSLSWAHHQRSAALEVLHGRKRTPVRSVDGLLIDESGLVLVVKPTA